MANIGAAFQNMIAQISTNMSNITLTNVAGSITRIVPNAMEKLSQGFSNSLVLNTEKYNSLVTNLGEEDSLVLQLIGLVGYTIYSNLDLVVMYIHLIVAALFPIVIGAFASLGRPSSADKPSKKVDANGVEIENENEPVEMAMETLGKTDALMFPIIAGVMLSGLYLLITYFEITNILNKLMSAYFSLVGIGAIAKLAADSLNVFTTFIFPERYVSKGQTYHVDHSSARFIDFQDETNGKLTPFPGPFSNSKLLSKYSSQLWRLRALFTERFVIKIQLRRIFRFSIGDVRLNDIIGLGIGFSTILLHNVRGSWLSMNLMGFSFCYTSFLFMSPTTFPIGCLLLMGLFFYDIIMVFYTPMMVAVATSLDIPIKLVFPGPKRGSMLGLGDIVLPGLMICLALRFDLYLHYLRKQTATGKEHHIIKAPYIDVSGKWGDWFWTLGAPKKYRPDHFPKVYFTASVVGYVFGLLTTLICLNIFSHAQPALLYLVPGVLVSLWTTALVRRELSLMWSYSEAAQDGSDESIMGSKSAKEKKSPVSILASKAEIKVSAKNEEQQLSTKSMKENIDQSNVVENTKPAEKKSSHFFVMDLSVNDIVKAETARKEEEQNDSHSFFSFSFAKSKNKIKVVKVT